MSIISKKVLPVKAMLSMSLSIPSYQRPYKWQDKHVNQLLDDVIFHRGKSSYRLGTIVLHKDEQEGQLNIVDGQQRLLTLTLLSVLLDKERSFRPKLLEQTFDSAMTQENLRHNAAVIESRTKQLSESDREALVDFVQQKCQLITVTLNDLSEAFQFFDSQNARGKALEPYDLLKAFHLREMVDNTEDERTLCVADWESSITPDNNVSDKGQRENLPSLHTIMSDYLFRLRCWSDVQPGRWFTRHHIDVFKGVNLNQNKYPLAAAMRALDYQVDHYNQDRVRQWDQHKMGYPFQVNQTLLNGKRFFEYVQHYITLYKTLFIDDKPELAALLKTINNYEGRSRKGDHYVRNLFYCAVMFYYDRFGDEALESAATICFLWSYRIRLEQHRVVIESIDNHAREPDGLISTIKRALHHNQVLSYPIAPLEETFVKNKSTKVEGLIAKFKDLKVYAVMKTSEPDNKQLSDQHKDITELSVSELFKNGQYVIPIYQRNYAWGEPEVEQLIQDIMDVATKNKDSDYFIGSLVVYTRKNGVYETIDGQQRHTTLSIILSVLKHAYKQSLDHIDHINLGFDSRPKSDQTLRRLFKNPEQATDEPEERTIRSAYEVARRFLAQPECDVDAFTNYLLHKVKILRVVVPEDTDLNHYFEIMNNRGEQLEKHEVLKARMMKDLGDLERTAFAAIWDACADMNRYVQLGINSAYREKVFGRDWNHMPVDFDDLCSAFAESADYSKELSLAAIIEKPALKLSRPKTVSEEAGTFSTIVTFPNFLLHALRLLTEDDVPLDDKRLLESFSEYMPKDKSSGWFVIELLKIRMLFDSYIIKRENEEDWSLKSLKLYKNGKQKSFGYVNSCDDEKLNTQLIMLLSMFHVSFPAQVYKHWLNAALKYLCTTSMDNEYWTIEGKDYLAHLERLSDSFFYGRYGVNSGGEPIDYYELIYKDAKLPDEFDMDNLSLGTNVQNFLFNRLDYQLWKRLINNVPFDGVDMKYIRQRLNSFSFTFRTSVEHYYPQHPITGNKLKESDTLPNGVDSFGNLCLISRSNNSKLSNYLPKAKKDHYEKATTVESLKQIFMMSYEDWGPDCPEVIAEHESMMIEVLYGDI